MSDVFIAFQDNEEARPFIEAAVKDNPHARVERMPSMVRILAPKSLTIRRETVEEIAGRKVDMQSIHVNLITLTGHVDEEDDYLRLYWKH